MDGHITTYSGIYFYPLEPEAEKIDIRDIAHCLPFICRGNGHVRTFWSVGSHSVLCAREAEARNLGPRMILACLMHDASECYMSDVPRPFKQSLRDYVEREEALTEMIYVKFLGSPLTDEERSLLNRIDDAFLWYDLKYLLNDASGEEPDTILRPDYSWRGFDSVEREFTEIFEKYTEELSRMR